MDSTPWMEWFLGRLGRAIDGAQIALDFRETQIQRRIGNQAAVCQAIEQWIDGHSGKPAARSTAKGGVWVKRLQRILGSGDRRIIEAIQHQLQFYEEYIEHQGRDRRRRKSV